MFAVNVDAPAPVNDPADAPPPPTCGGDGALTGAGASTFTANTQAQQTDLSTIGQDVPVSQVVVLESDITGTQSKVAVQEAKSSF